MKRTLIVGLALLIALPTAHAATTPAGATITKETDKIYQSSYKTLFLARLEYTVNDAAAYQAVATWDAYVPTADPSPQFGSERGGNATTISSSRLQKDPSPQGPYALFHVDAKNLYADLKNGETLAIVVSYSLPMGPTFDADHRIAYNIPQLAVFAFPVQGYEPSSSQLPAFVDIDTAYHSAVLNASADLDYQVTFRQASMETAPAGPRDFNRDLYAVAAIVVGIIVGLMIGRRGRGPRKFEKGGTMESKDMLEARRRTLMAALKELELGHEAKEVPDNAYAPLKEEYKAQAVRVMRNLEAKQEPPKP